MEDGLGKPHLEQSPSAVGQLLPHPARLGAGRAPEVKRTRLLLRGDRPACAGVQGVCREPRAGRASRRVPREGCGGPGPGPWTGGAETRTVQRQEARSEPRRWHEEAVEVGRCEAQGGAESAPIRGVRGRHGGPRPLPAAAVGRGVWKLRPSPSQGGPDRDELDLCCSLAL